MSEQITLSGGLIADRCDDGPTGRTYSIELANPTTGRITVLRVQLPGAEAINPEIYLAAAWQGLEPRPLDALAPRWLAEAVERIVPELRALEAARAASPAPAR